MMSPYLHVPYGKLSDGVGGQDVFLYQTHLDEAVGLRAFLGPVLVTLFLRSRSKKKRANQLHEPWILLAVVLKASTTQGTVNYPVDRREG